MAKTAEGKAAEKVEKERKALDEKQAKDAAKAAEQAATRSSSTPLLARTSSSTTIFLQIAAQIAAVLSCIFAGAMVYNAYSKAPHAVTRGQ